jgi:hypothetical protein
MNELIEKLKKNEKPFGLLSKEEQECLNKIPLKYIKGFYGEKWETPMSFVRHIAYYICPDYQPEPEYEDYEIKENGNQLGIWEEIEEGVSHWIPLWEIPAEPKFKEFWYELYGYNVSTTIDKVASEIRNGYKVFARLYK